MDVLEISKVCLRDKDVVVLKVDRRLMAEEREMLVGRLNQLFPNNKAAVLEPGMSLEVWSQDGNTV